MADLIPGWAKQNSTQPSPSSIASGFVTRRRELYSGGPFVSPLGFGSYRIGFHPNLGFPQCQHALELSLLHGTNLIDTSTNYGDGQSELLIGRTLQKLFSENKLKRENIVVVSKVGYLQGGNLELAQVREREGTSFTEVSKFGDELWHCFSPDFIRDQVDRSRARLQLDTIDVYLLHNPEYLLKKFELDNVPVADARAEFYKRCHKAFVCLEELVAEGKIAAYGVSSNTFGFPEEDPTGVELQTLWEQAEKIKPNHHMKVIQFPLNWLEVAPAFMPVKGNKESILALASTLGVGVLLNRPLNAMLNNGLIRLSRPQISVENVSLLSPAERAKFQNWHQLANDMERLAKEVIEAPGFEEASLSQLVLANLMSLPGVSSVLLGMRKTAYVKDAEVAVNLPKLLGARKILSRIYESLEFSKSEEN